MKIKSKFDLNEKVWVVEKDNDIGAVLVYKGEVEEIIVTKDRGIIYFITGSDGEYEEDDLVKDGNNEELTKRVKVLGHLLFVDMLKEGDINE